MGFIQQSTTKKIYAYLTQFAKGKILDGNEEDFTVKYFSLHDSDVNYKISANLVNNSYNTLPSGFIPDITGDNQGCLFSIANGIQLDNSLGGFEEPPEPISLFGTVVGSCTIDDTYRFEINVTNIQGGTGGYSWYVKTDVISFPNSTTLIEDATILSTTPSPNYAVGTPQYFNATFNFSDTYLPREADSYNFTVYARDSSGTEVEIGKFTDINCSKRTFGVVPFPDMTGDNVDLNPNYPSINLITESQLDSISRISTSKIGFALFVIDNGNRRKDLNLTTADRLAYDADGDGIYLAIDTTKLENTSPPFTPFKSIALSNTYRIPFNTDISDIVDNAGYHSQSVLRQGPISNPINAQENWLGQLSISEPPIIPTTSYNNIEQIINNTLNFKYDIMHPTVKPFDDMIEKGFDISYIELALKYSQNTVDEIYSDFGYIPLPSRNNFFNLDNDAIDFPVVALPPQIGFWFYPVIFFTWDV